MRPLRTTFLLALALVRAGCAQDPGTLAVRDAELTQRAVAALHELADRLEAENQHARALELRREIWMDYATDDKRARERTGFLQVGRLWRLDPDALVLDRDLKGKAGKLRRIDRDWDKLAKELLAEHRALAEAFTALGDELRAGRHWQRVLRFKPGDEAASKALLIREFEGFVGTERDLRMLRRGRAIHLACDWLNRTEFPVAPIDDGRLPLLEAAGIAHQGVRSEHFRVWGSIALGDLTTIAQDCERALLLTRTLFGVSTGEVFQPVQLRNVVFVRSTPEYHATMEVCRSQFSADRFDFLRDVVDMCYLEHGGESLRVYKGELGLAVCRDQAVRGVVQDAVGPKTDGLWEGLGHAACGFLFGRTLTFLQEQLKERTSASHVQRRLAPDLETWMRIAQESAWAKSDTRTSELVLIQAAKFTNEQRVKAWAICHYLFHWRPELLIELDACKTDGVRTAPEVEREFERRTGYPLPKIDAEWRDFWGRGAELRAAMTRDPVPDAKAKTRKAIDRSRALVDAVNALRAATHVGPAGYYLDASADFRAVRRYEQDLEKAEREQQKRERLREKGRRVEDVEMPTPPAALGTTVLWSRAADVAAAADEWYGRPDLREALLQPGRELFAVPSDTADGGLLLGVAYPAVPTRRGEPLVAPRPGQRDVACAVPVASLDPRARAAVLAAGVGADATVGQPLTLHFGRSIGEAVAAQVRCRAFEINRPVEGVVVSYEAAVDGAPAVPGLVAFVPLAPFAPGKAVEAQWQVPQSLLGADRRLEPVLFHTR